MPSARWRRCSTPATASSLVEGTRPPHTKQLGAPSGRPTAPTVTTPPRGCGPRRSPRGESGVPGPPPAEPLRVKRWQRGSEGDGLVHMAEDQEEPVGGAARIASDQRPSLPFRPDLILVSAAPGSLPQQCKPIDLRTV